MLLAIIVMAGQQHPHAFAEFVDHLDWLAPPMDARTGIVLEQTIAGASAPADLLRPRAEDRFFAR